MSSATWVIRASGRAIEAASSHATTIDANSEPSAASARRGAISRSTLRIVGWLVDDGQHWTRSGGAAGAVAIQPAAARLEEDEAQAADPRCRAPRPAGHAGPGPIGSAAGKSMRWLTQDIVGVVGDHRRRPAPRPAARQARRPGGPGSRTHRRGSGPGSFELARLGQDRPHQCAEAQDLALLLVLAQDEEEAGPDQHQRQEDDRGERQDQPRTQRVCRRQRRQPAQA